MSQVSALTTSTSSSRSKNLISRMKQRREYSSNSQKSFKRSGKGGNSKCAQVKEEEEEDLIAAPKGSNPPGNASDHLQQLYGYPPSMAVAGIQPAYFMPPMQPVMQAPHVMMPPPLGWYPGQQQGMASGVMTPDMMNAGMISAGMTVQQLKDQQLIFQQQQEIIQQQQQLQQDQLQKQQEMLKNQQRLLQDPPLLPPPIPSPAAATPAGNHEDDVPVMQADHPHLSRPLLDQLRGRVGKQASLKSIGANNDHEEEEEKKDRTDLTEGGVRDSTVSAKSSATRTSDEFTVGILGIGDVTVLEKTIGLLKKNSFSDQFNPEKSNEGGATKHRNGMQSSFVEKTKDGLSKRPSDRRTSQVLNRANQKLETRESLELDFNDVYSGKKESFVAKSGLLDSPSGGDASKGPRKSFKRQGSNGGRSFAYENPNFSH